MLYRYRPLTVKQLHALMRTVPCRADEAAPIDIAKFQQKTGEIIARAAKPDRCAKAQQRSHRKKPR